MVGKIITISLVCFSLISISLPVLAGNIILVEKKIEELDKLNKLIISTTTSLPSEGIITIKARVYARPTNPIFVLISKEFSRTKEGIFPFNKPNNRFQPIRNWKL